jgi:glutamate synthase (NADPH/NADH) large chain
MTSGTVVILGDPGPYAFSGMTGGVVYQLLTPELGFDEEALRRRLARGAQVVIEKLDQADIAPLRTLLGYYIEALEQTYQSDASERMRALCHESVLLDRFLRINATPQPALAPALAALQQSSLVR